MPKSESYSKLFQRAHQHIMNRGHRHGDYSDGAGWRGSRGGGWRGGRGRGKGDWGREKGQDRGQDNQNRHAERERPPPCLRGRDIGMWYAERSRARREQENLNRPTVALDERKESSIRQLLNNIERVDSVQPQRNHDFNLDNTEGDGGWWNGQATDGVSLEVAENWEDVTEEPLFSEACGGCSHSAETDRPCSSQEQVCVASGSSTVADEENVEDDLPQISGLLEYNRVHGDTIYLDQGVDKVCELEADNSVSGLRRNAALDERLKIEAQERMSDVCFVKMMDFRKKLPSNNMKQELVDLIRDNKVVVVSGETGCGKTTQVPQFVLDDFIERGMGSLCHIICTQPRRISAVSVAERVATERCEKCGGDNSSVGYQIRLEVQKPRPQGSILFCTTGIVLKFLEKDPLLQRATHVILDEIHERDLQSDFLMIILKDLLPRRPDLKVVLMSATLNAEMFSKYFNGSPIINIPGFTYPVQEFLLEDVLQLTGYKQSPSSRKKPSFSLRRKNRQTQDEEEWNYQAWLRNLDARYSRSTIEALRHFDYSHIDLDLIVTLIRYIVTTKEDGAILVFVPGWEEISKLHKQLQADATLASGCVIIPLHSLMPTVNQRQVFDRPPHGVRKIVIATNIAETSITIDDIVFVVDCGKIKVKDYDPGSNISCLEPQWVSKANSRQRRGRAGRVQAGYCYHLYTGLKWLEMVDYLPPEMLRTRLEELCLQIKLLKLGRIELFVSKAMQPPSMEALHKAIVTLQELNALDSEENLLPLGYHLARMPMDPHTGKMILFGAMFCCLDPILTVAASLSFRDAFFIPLGREKEADAKRKELSDGSKSDHILLINAMKGWERSLSRGTDRQFCWDYFLSANTLKMLSGMKKQLAEVLYDLNFVDSKNPSDKQANIHSEDLGLVKAVLCAGLYPHVAKVVKLPKHKTMTVGTHIKNGSGKTFIHPKSVNSQEKEFESKWLVYYHMLKTSKVYIHDCTMVSPYPLLFFGGSINLIMDGGQECISVDDWIVFKASRSTAQLVKDLRRQLDKLLEEKIVRPGATIWNEAEKEGALMHAIVELISTEDAEAGVGGGGEDARRHRSSDLQQGRWKDKKQNRK